MDRHVSIEKYNMLWFKGIGAQSPCPKSVPKVSYETVLRNLLRRQVFRPKGKLKTAEKVFLKGARTEVRRVAFVLARGPYQPSKKRCG
jgi:hypothetical protein